ncbi:hypothetical protein GCM10023086_36460 [Streptomyces venetus]|uniref:Secreted protein n=1 Tax=Streptomyces venetus TaxID=1701086 RepID=A0ABP8G0P5_9ACTN
MNVKPRGIFLKSALCAGAALIAAPSVSGGSAAATTGGAAAGPVAWSATHGTATAAGTRWTEASDSGAPFSALVIEGELRNSGSECYSVWVRWMRDLVPGPYTKQATQCGTGSAPVNIRLGAYLPTTTGDLKVCRGNQDTKDCGEPVSLTSWPVTGTSRAAG